jgi:hypothetical protein
VQPLTLLVLLSNVPADDDPAGLMYGVQKVDLSRSGHRQAA